MEARSMNGYSVVIKGDAIPSATVRVSRGTTIADSVPLFEVEPNGMGVLTVLASRSGSTYESSPALDGAVGLAYASDSAESIFVSSGGAALAGVSVSTPVSSGTLPTTKADTAGNGFIAGVAVGIALGSK